MLDLVPRSTQHFTKIDHKKRKIDYVNIDLSHQYGISVAESQTFLRAKRPQQRRARKNGWFRMLHQTLCYTFNPPTVITFNLPCLQISSHMTQLSWWRLTISFCCSCCKGVADFFIICDELISNQGGYNTINKPSCLLTQFPR